MEITRPVPSPNPVEQTDAALLQTAEEVSDAVFRSVPLPPLMREHFWVQSSVFAGCIFPAPVLQGSHFTDVTFRNCDLSNADLSGCSFQRVEFVECKLVGANLSEGTWQHVVFERCKMEFANFTLGKFRGVRFAGGTMQRRIRRMPVRTCGVLALRPYDGGIQSDTVEGAFVRRFGYSRNPGRRYRIVRAERFESQCAAGFGAGASSGTGNRGVIVIQKIYIILKKY